MVEENQRKLPFMKCLHYKGKALIAKHLSTRIKKIKNKKLIKLITKKKQHTYIMRCLLKITGLNLRKC